MNKIVVQSDDMLVDIYKWFLKNRELIMNDFKIPFEEGCVDLGYGVLHFKAAGANISVAVKTKNIDRDFDFRLDTTTWKIAFSSLPLYADEPERATHVRDQLAIVFCGIMALIVYHKDAVAESLIRTKEPVAPAKTSKHKSKSKSKSKPVKPQTQHIYVLQSFEPKEATKKLKAAKRKYTKPTTEVQVRGHYRTYPSGKRVWVKPFTKYNGKKSSKDKEYIL